MLDAMLSIDLEGDHAECTIQHCKQCAVPTV
jgi:hypothetical protein